jgi:mediator of RNA polymerase II transcription subunit 14
VLELAQMPVPSLDGVNGFITAADDNSVENIQKKVSLLKFIEQTHSDWTKALVITHWSRVSGDLGKIIDLHAHLKKQTTDYDWAVEELVQLKRDMLNARLPNPDFKTAIEVLSTGKASWMPDVSTLTM